MSSVSFRYCLYYYAYKLVSPDKETLLNMQREYEEANPHETPAVFEAERVEFSYYQKSHPTEADLQNFAWED